MTNENAATANQDLRPIQDWENREVDGKGLACKRVHDTYVERVASLRKRQEAYEASLPKEPLEALSEISRTLVDTADVGEKHYAPRAALEIVQQLANHRALDDSEQMKDAIFWLVGQGLDGLRSIEEASGRAKNIAHQFHPTHEAYKA